MLKTSLENELERWNYVIRSKPNDANAYVRRGMVYFKLAKIDASIQDFDRAEMLNPAILPYLWQRGLSFYYADRFEEGAKQFEVDLRVNAQDVEETVWRYLCIARAKGVAEARNSLLIVRNDPRLVMRRVYDLYAGNCTIDDVMAVGKEEGDRGMFYSHLYIGLYYEAENNTEMAKQYIIKAVEEHHLDDYMWNVASVHKTMRGWSSPG